MVRPAASPRSRPKSIPSTELYHGVPDRNRGKRIERENFMPPPHTADPMGTTPARPSVRSSRIDCSQISPFKQLTRDRAHPFIGTDSDAISPRHSCLRSAWELSDYHFALLIASYHHTVDGLRVTLDPYRMRLFMRRSRISMESKTMMMTISSIRIDLYRDDERCSMQYALFN
jgi:hypothetical protein